MNPTCFGTSSSSSRPHTGMKVEIYKNHSWVSATLELVDIKNGKSRARIGESNDDKQILSNKMFGKEPKDEAARGKLVWRQASDDISSSPRESSLGSSRVKKRNREQQRPSPELMAMIDKHIQDILKMERGAKMNEKDFWKIMIKRMGSNYPSPRENLRHPPDWWPYAKQRLQSVANAADNNESHASSRTSTQKRRTPLENKRKSSLTALQQPPQKKGHNSSESLKMPRKDNTKIVVLVKEADKPKTSKKVKLNRLFKVKKLLKNFSKRLQVAADQIRLIFDGFIIDPEKTFEEVGIEQGDQIDLHIVGTAAAAAGGGGEAGRRRRRREDTDGQDKQLRKEKKTKNRTQQNPSVITPHSRQQQQQQQQQQPLQRGRKRRNPEQNHQDKTEEKKGDDRVGGDGSGSGGEGEGEFAQGNSMEDDAIAGPSTTSSIGDNKSSSNSDDATTVNNSRHRIEIGIVGLDKHSSQQDPTWCVGNIICGGKGGGGGHSNALRDHVVPAQIRVKDWKPLESHWHLIQNSMMRYSINKHAESLLLMEFSKNGIKSPFANSNSSPPHLSGNDGPEEVVGIAEAFPSSNKESNDDNCDVVHSCSFPSSPPFQFFLYWQRGDDEDDNDDDNCSSVDNAAAAAKKNTAGNKKINDKNRHNHWTSNCIHSTFEMTPSHICK
mmetsp:Transcript_2603/g.3965  ORF Transcript_2603/g.3965 Transcript_2603/m.3965 type:complete len:666 (-) Transcript_2603:1452-3449(-)